MDQFQYTLKMQEMETLTTKKAKQEFIKEVGRLSRWHSSALEVKLAINTLKFFKDQKLVGLSGMVNKINLAIFGMDTEQLEVIGDIPTTPVTAGNDYHDFMASSGIPAYIKAAVIKARHVASDI